MHIIGAIIAIIYCWKSGIFSDSAKYGDGIRWALPSDILFECLVLWEINLFVYTLYRIENWFNDLWR